MHSSTLFILKKKHIYDSTYQSNSTYSDNGSYSDTIESGLYNSANFIHKMLKAAGMKSHLSQVIDNNCIDREVTKYKPSFVIIEAIWVVPEKFKILAALHPNVHWIIRLHSEMPFISNEGNAIDWIFEYSKLSETIKMSIAPNTDKMYSDLKAIGIKNLVMLPNYYPIVHKPFTDIEEKPFINIGCFGAIRPMKNQLIQAVAAIKFGNTLKKPIHFHINSGRIENGNNALRNMRALFANQEHHELVEHGWYPHAKFLKLISLMDMGLQVSFNETFNIVAADFVSQNIPLVGSKEIDWLNFIYKVGTTDSSEMATRMQLAYGFRNFNLQYLNKMNLYSFSLKSENTWLNYLKSL